MPEPTISNLSIKVVFFQIGKVIRGKDRQNRSIIFRESLEKWHQLPLHHHFGMRVVLFLLLKTGIEGEEEVAKAEKIYPPI